MEQAKIDIDLYLGQSDLTLVFVHRVDEEYLHQLSLK